MDGSQISKYQTLSSLIRQGGNTSPFNNITKRELQEFYENPIWKAHLELWSVRANQLLVQLMTKPDSSMSDERIRGAFAELLHIIMHPQKGQEDGNSNARQHD